ncbi:hypothetical protein [Euzebya sp.]|uniref:hypothetical protein n=1 Tax=Euzebya sp. TaxID=1971409 RepID=UPI003513B642
MSDPLAPPPPPPPAPSGGTSAIDIIAGIILGLAATIAAFAAYQGALADGNSLEGYTQSTQHLSDANFFYNASSQQFVRDQQLFTAFATAANTPGQEQVAEYIRTALMDENLQDAVDWWAATEDAVTPFDDLEGNPYVDAAGAEADAQQTAAEEAFAEGAEANEVGDRFELAGVILAITLFFGGIATLIGSPKIAWVLMGVAAVTLLSGAGLVVSAMGA